MLEYEQFIGTVREAGTGSLEITIPFKIVEFMGLSKGTDVKVMIQKIEKVE